MQHLEEQTLTLYVLNAEAIQARREEISAHLEGCQGCRALEVEIRAYYGDVEQELARLQKEEAASALVPAAPQVRVMERRPSVQFSRYRAPLSRVERSRLGIRRHPVAAGSAGLGVLAALAALLIFGPGVNRSSHGEPAYYRLDEATKSLQIIDREDRQVWQMAVNDVDRFKKLEDDYGYRLTQIADFRGAGTNQVLTGLSFLPGDNRRNMALRLFDSDRHLLWERKFGQDLTYGRRAYPADYTVSGIAIWRESPGAPREAIVTATDERSPCTVVRLDKDGKTLGEYWHFGHLVSITAVPLGKEQMSDLVLCGTNDAADTSNGEYPVVVVLDPTKITGQKASPMAPGFAMPHSDAERYYLKMPFPALRDSGILNCSTLFMKLTQDSLMTFCVKSRRDEQYPMVYFTFDRDFRLRSVWIDNNSAAVFREDLQARGLEPDLQRYIIGPMMQAVRYWNGRRWVAEPTSVQAPAPHP